MRRGLTLPELLCVLAIVGLAAAVAIPPLVHTLDRIAVDETADRYAVMHEATRQLAIARATLARLEVDTARTRVTLSVPGPAGWDTVDVRSLGATTLSTTQPVVTFAPLGYAWGLSNTTIIARRGTVAETLTVSRTGRLKRS